MRSLRIMTTVHLANHGGCIFAGSLYNTLRKYLPGYDVRTLDYIPRNWLYHELARALKPQPGALTFNLRRLLVSEKFHRESLGLDRPTAFYPLGYEGMVEFLRKKAYDALVVGMVIWDITELPQIPRFPNIYWLSERIPSVKIAYASSGHRSRAPLIQKNREMMRKILSSYALIGVRDQLTWELVLESKADRDVPVIRVPDPTILYEDQPTRVRDILRSYGVDLDRPILGVLFYGKPAFSEELCRQYRAQGYQTVALSMYNPYADVNLGDRLSPYEWADAFKYLSFCVTDRFHGTIFCLKNNIPFLSIEPYSPETMKNSKIYSLLDDFGMTENYANPYLDDFEMGAFLERARYLGSNWKEAYQPKVSAKMEEMRSRSLAFVQQIKSVLAV